MNAGALCESVNIYKYYALNRGGRDFQASEAEVPTSKCFPHALTYGRSPLFGSIRMSCVLGHVLGMKQAARGLGGVGRC